MRGLPKANREQKNILLVPDRAVLQITGIDDKARFTELLKTFDAPLHALNASGARVGRVLEPLLFRGDASSIGTEISTRAQAVLAEAIVSSCDVMPMPKADHFAERWAKIVNVEHAARLTQDSPTTFSAPVALVDDHRSGSRITISLATLKIRLGPNSPDVRFTYHTVYELNAGRGGMVDLVKDIAKVAHAGDEGARQLLKSLREQQLPTLVLSDNGAGGFAAKDYADDLPDGIPLLREHPRFDYARAAICLSLFRMPEAHQVGGRVPWQHVIPGWTYDGSLDGDVAALDNMVAESVKPSAQKTYDLDTADGGEVRQDAREVEDEIETNAATGTGIDGDEGGIPDGVITTDKTDGTSDGTVSGDAMGGSGALALSPPSAEEAISKLAREGQGDGATTGNDGVNDKEEAGTDDLVTDRTVPSEPRKNDLDTADGGEVRQDAPKVEDEIEAYAATGTPDGLLFEIGDSLTDADQVILKTIRVAMSKPRKQAEAMMEWRKWPTNAELWSHRDALNAVLEVLVEKQMKTPGKKDVTTMRKARDLYHSPDRWPRMLLVLNICAAMNDSQLKRGVAGVPTIREATTNAILQCVKADVVYRTPAATAVARPPANGSNL